MRTILMLLVIIVSTGCSESQSWHKNQPDYSKSYDASRDAVADLMAAQTKAKSEDKNVLIVVGGEWCSWCHILNDYLDKNHEVANRLVENYVVVKVNIDENGEGSELLNTLPEFRGVPHFYVVNPTGRVIVSQETSVLEEERGYNDDKFINFLEQYKNRKKKAE